MRPSTTLSVFLHRRGEPLQKKEESKMNERKTVLRGTVLSAGLVLLAVALQGTPVMAQTLGMVADNFTDRVIIFNADTDTVLGSVPVGPGSVGDCSITPDQTRGFVTDFQDRIWVIDLTTLALAPGTNPIPISNNGEDTSVTPKREIRGGVRWRRYSAGLGD